MLLSLYIQIMLLAAIVSPPSASADQGTSLYSATHYLSAWFCVEYC